MSEELEADVAIVGAGLAGLAAAREIAAAGGQPLVLEARERVGGRVFNEEIGGSELSSCASGRRFGASSTARAA